MARKASTSECRRLKKVRENPRHVRVCAACPLDARFAYTTWDWYTQQVRHVQRTRPTTEAPRNISCIDTQTMSLVLFWLLFLCKISFFFFLLYLDPFNYYFFFLFFFSFSCISELDARAASNCRFPIRGATIERKTRSPLVLCPRIGWQPKRTERNRCRDGKPVQKEKGRLRACDGQMGDRRLEENKNETRRRG